MSNAEPELNFMDKLWEAANRLRGSLDAAEYKHVVLGFIFLKYISDMFLFRRKWLENVIRDPKNEEYYIPNASEEDIKEILEDKDEYLAAGVFYVPPEARWAFLVKNAMQPNIGKLIDEGMSAIERENPKQLRGVLPKIYTRATVSPQILGELVNLFSKVGFEFDEDKDKDVLGRVYEYFIGKFAEAEGKRGGQFYTPRCVVKLLVEILEPFEGRVYDPACGSGGMFVQSWKFIETHHKDPYATSVYGQELNETTWRICKMNLGIRGVPNENIAWGDTMLDNKFSTLKADFIITNPPFNMTRWGANRVRNDARWKYGIPDDRSKNGGNYAWIQHYIYHLAPNGRAGFVMANGSLSILTRYGKIRASIVEDDLVDCIVTLPPKLFLTTPIPACLWFLAKSKNESKKGFRDRRREILFIDARDLYKQVSKRLNSLTDEHIELIAKTYSNWRKGKGYKDIPGFCKSVTVDEVRKNRYILTPSMYVGVAEEEFSYELSDESVNTLTTELEKQLKKSQDLQNKIRKTINFLKKPDWSQIVKYDEHGEFVTLAKVCSAIVDCSHAKKPPILGEGEYIFLEVKNIGENGELDLTEVSYVSEEDFLAWTKRLTPQKDDIIISKTGRVGAVAIIPDEIKRCIGRNQVILRPNPNKVLPRYLLYYMLSPQFRKEIQKLTMSGTVLESLHVKFIPHLKVELYPLEIQQKIVDILDPLYRKIEVTLPRIRDALVSKIFSGEAETKAKPTYSKKTKKRKRAVQKTLPTF